MTQPARGEVWYGDLDPAVGHEQAGRRPLLVVSINTLNQGPSELVIVVPITSKIRPIASHIRISPPEGGLSLESSILCENVRSISTERLSERWGIVTSRTMAAVEDRLSTLLGILDKSANRRRSN